MTKPSRRPAPREAWSPGAESSIHEDDQCHWYYDGGVICAPDGSQDFVTVTADRAVFDEWDAVGRACRDCVEMLHA